MTNLHETGWHDYLGGPISGWQRQYSAHIKNANVYAEAARWAGGLYANPTGAFFGDLDNDGVDELVMYNDRVLAVFESIGGRAAWVFAKDGGSSYSVVGVDNAYWYGTEGDYNDGNHIAALSDVGPDHQHDFYAMTVDTSSGNTVQATLHRLRREEDRAPDAGAALPRLHLPGRGQHPVRPERLVARPGGPALQRRDGPRLGPDVSYMGRRNPNTGATGAWVLGGGGAQFQKEVGGTLMKADEIHGTQKFEVLLYAGPASAPDGSGHTPELQALAAALGDRLPPEAVSGTYFPATRQLTPHLRRDGALRRGHADRDRHRRERRRRGRRDARRRLLGAERRERRDPHHPRLERRAHRDPGCEPHRDAPAAAGRGGAGRGRQRLRPAHRTPATCRSPTDRRRWSPWTAISTLPSGRPAPWRSRIRATRAGTRRRTRSCPSAASGTTPISTWGSAASPRPTRGCSTSTPTPTGPTAITNLTAIDHWERGATFTASGFKPDWQFGAYQHQGVYDGQSFWKLLSATTSADSSAAILTAFDPMHLNGLDGGSEIAIPWNTLYGLGAGRVPANCRIGFVASLAWDPEPDGALGGDQAPDNLSATPPVLDDFRLVTVDADGDGVPDPSDRTAPTLVAAAYSGWDSLVTLQFSEPVTAATAEPGLALHRVPDRQPVGVADRAQRHAAGRPAPRAPAGLPMSYVGYTVVASGVADTSCFHNASPQTGTAFQGPPVTVDPGPRRRGRSRWPTRRPTRRGVGRCSPTPCPGPAARPRSALELYDLGGRLVRTLVRAMQPAGRVPAWRGTGGTTAAGALRRASTSCDFRSAPGSR